MHPIPQGRRLQNLARLQISLEGRARPNPDRRPAFPPGLPSLGPVAPERLERDSGGKSPGSSTIRKRRIGGEAARSPDSSSEGSARHRDEAPRWIGSTPRASPTTRDASPDLPARHSIAGCATMGGATRGGKPLVPTAFQVRTGPTSSAPTTSSRRRPGRPPAPVARGRRSATRSASGSMRRRAPRRGLHPRRPQVVRALPDLLLPRPAAPPGVLPGQRRPEGRLHLLRRDGSRKTSATRPPTPCSTWRSATSRSGSTKASPSTSKGPPTGRG